MNEQNLTTEIKPALPLWARILLSIIGFVIATGIFQFIGILASGTSFTNLEELQNMTPGRQLFLQLMGFLAMCLVVYLFRKFVDRKSIKSMGFSIKNRMSDLFAGFLMAIIIIGGGTFLLNALGYVEFVGMHLNVSSLILSFFVFVFVALTEEIFMRGYILNNLMTRMNKYWALLLSAIIFALFHGFNFNMSWLAMFNLILAGIILGASYIYTRNLWFPISLHLFWNFFQGPILGYQVSGNETESLIQIKTMGDPMIHGGAFGYEGSIICSILVALASILIIFYYQKKSAKPKLVVV